MKKLHYLVLLGLCLVFSFTSCSDDDDDDDKKVLSPTAVVTNLSFTDTDYEEGKIGGKLQWSLPSDESGVTGYVVYISSSNTQKGTEVGSVAVGVDQYEIPAGTDYQAFLNVVSKNSEGEATTFATIAVKDNTSPVIMGLSFVDTDNSYQKIGGTVTWVAPEVENGLNGYVLYLSDKKDEKGSKLVEVGSEETFYTIPAGTDFKAYLQIAVVMNDIEARDFVSLSLKDLYETETLALYILNRGNYGANNATVFYQNLISGNVVNDLYKTANNSALGESAENILVYGSKVYVAVTFSNRLAILDLQGKLLETIEPKDGENTLNPRGLVAENGKVYVSYYYGHSVAVIDTLSLKEEKRIKVGRYPEQVAVANDKLYVANSGGGDAPDYGNTVSVIDLNTLNVEKEIEVVINPTRLKVDKEGHVYVISMGNYGNIESTLQRIDKTTSRVTTMGNANLMSIFEDKLYAIHAPYGTTSPAFTLYSTTTGNVVNNNFLATPGITNPNSLDVDPSSGQIYISNYDYNATSTMYVFDADGKQERSFDTEGYDTQGVTFLVHPK